MILLYNTLLTNTNQNETHPFIAHDDYRHF
jgi:hypothetical protein